MRRTSVVFDDRLGAGLRLGLAVLGEGFPDPVVLGLPRGGVPVAAAVAQVMGVPLDVIVVRKLGVPDQPELAMGAIGEDGAVVMNDDIVRFAEVRASAIAREERAERAVLDARLSRIRAVRPREPLAGRTAVVVDDGIATGATMRAAVRVARAHGARRVAVAAPVAPPEAVREFRSLADDVVVLEQPDDFLAVGNWYHDFRAVGDDEVLRLIVRASRRPTSTHVGIETGAGPHSDRLIADLTVPADPVGAVVFAHGSGSSRRSPRNVAVARMFERGGVATLLVDLQTEAETATGIDVGYEVLAGRVVRAVEWLAAQPSTAGIPVGLMGASTGAAVAVRAAVAAGDRVVAVVSRGGRLDLADDALAELAAPTLCIVGSADELVLDLNRRALRSMGCITDLVVVDGASHLFGEPGTLDSAAVAAYEWFHREFAHTHAEQGD